MRLFKYFAAITASYFLVCHSQAGAETLKFGWEPWEPYEYINSSGKLTGIDIEVVEAAAAASGLSIEWKESPWSRILQEIENGALAGTPAASVTPERRVWGVFSAAYREEATSLLRSAGSPDVDLSTLIAQGRKVGIVNNYDYGDAVSALVSGPRGKDVFEAVSSDDLNIRKVAADRIGAALINPYVAASRAKALGVSGQVAISAVPVSSGPVHVLLAKKAPSPEARDAFIKGIEVIRENGTLAAILNSYLH